MRLAEPPASVVAALPPAGRFGCDRHSRLRRGLGCRPMAGVPGTPSGGQGGAAPPVVHARGWSRTPGACALAPGGHPRPAVHPSRPVGGENRGHRRRTAHERPPPPSTPGPRRWPERRQGDVVGAKAQAPGEIATTHGQQPPRAPPRPVPHGTAADTAQAGGPDPSPAAGGPVGRNRSSPQPAGRNRSRPRRPVATRRPPAGGRRTERLRPLPRAGSGGRGRAARAARSPA